jgi:hypothetical protein
MNGLGIFDAEALDQTQTASELATENDNKNSNHRAWDHGTADVGADVAAS